jgi:hypothetical protein
MKKLVAHSLEEYRQILDDLEHGRITILEEGEKPTIDNTIIEIDGTLEDLERWIHATGGCSFAELQERISDIMDEGLALRKDDEQDPPDTPPVP